MRFRMGFVAGMATGYVIGAKAGRERFEQIRVAWWKIKKTPQVERVVTKAGELIGMGVERGKLVVTDRFKNNNARHISVE